MITIIIPVYNEEDNINELYEELKESLENSGKSINEYEIIFVDDGSYDNTYSIIKNIVSTDKNVRLIKFMKNFGQTAALQAGFDHAKGDILIAMDGDLQNDPKDISKLIKKLNEGFDVVSGWRHERKDSVMKKIFSFIAYNLRKRLLNDTIHDSGCTLKAYKKQAIKDIRLYGEMHRYIPTLLSMNGYSVAEMEVSHRSRKHGKTKYGFKRILKGFLDLLYIKFWSDYSSRPLHLFGLFGLVQIGIAFILLFYNIIIYGIRMTIGPSLLLAALLTITGIQFIIFGFLGEILIRTFYKIGDEKTYTIKEIIN